jgi:serine/threonine protein kinase
MGDELFGPYRLDELIGQGGMGEVWRAFDTVKERTVALKRLPAYFAGDADFQARFRRESKPAAQLSEPHIIPIHDFGEINGQLFIDMRLVRGSDWPPSSLNTAHSRQHARRRSSPRSPAHWTPPTPPGSCTATSNRPTP